MNSKKIELQLLDNGLHFLIAGLDWKQVFNPGDEDLKWKYSVLNVYAGIELILKEKLKQEHWSLIFDNVEKANEQKLLIGDFQSVSYKNCLGRLNNICQIQLSNKAEENINELRNIRNRIQHYAFSLKIDETRILIAKALFSTLNFIDKFFTSDSFTSDQIKAIDILKKRLYNFKEYVDYKKEYVKKRLEAAEKNGKISPCPECRETTVISYTGKKSECLICGFETESHETALELFLKSLENQLTSIAKKEEECEDCNNTIMKFYDPMKMPPEIKVFCFGCGDKGTIPIEVKNEEMVKNSKPI